LRILGIVAETHDSGLALLDDGVPRLVLEEERFNREKHTLKFPRLALETAFAELKIGIRDIDVIATPWDIWQLRKTFAKAVLSRLPASLTLLRPGAHAAQDSGIVLLPFWLRHNLRTLLGSPKLPQIVQVGHHDAHAAIFFCFAVRGGGGVGDGRLWRCVSNQCLRRPR
jgi:carbamoyltransferase